ncbi:hypothetical protein AMTRI_Chr10g227180 [Amborella trichopoda]
MRAVSYGGHAQNPSSFSLFFLPTFSLAALLLLLSVCNGVTIFCLHLPFPVKPTSKSAHFSLENTEEENHLSKELETHRSFKLLTQKEDNENSLVPPLNTTVDGRIRWLKKNRSWFRILKSGPLLTKGYRVLAMAPDFDVITGKWSRLNNAVMAFKELGVSDSSGISWSPSSPLFISGEREVWALRERQGRGRGSLARERKRVWVERERERGSLENLLGER